MTNKTFRILSSALVFVWSAWFAHQAFADRIDRLARILNSEKDFKVRLQVVLTLGKLKDKRAVPALIRALSDENHTVRGMSASALGKIGDSRAVAPLKKVLKSDKHPFVRAQAVNALKLLKKTGGLQPGTRFYVTVGKIINQAKKGGASLGQVLKLALLNRFKHVSGITTEWPGGKNPSKAMLAKRRIQGFVLDGAIVKIEHLRKGSGYEVSCTIKVSLSTYPGNSMKAFYTGGAGMEVSANDLKSGVIEGIYRELIEGAAQEAKQHIVQSYLRNL